MVRCSVSFHAGMISDRDRQQQLQSTVFFFCLKSLARETMGFTTIVKRLFGDWVKCSQSYLKLVPLGIIIMVLPALQIAPTKTGLVRDGFAVWIWTSLLLFLTLNEDCIRKGLLCNSMYFQILLPKKNPVNPVFLSRRWLLFISKVYLEPYIWNGTRSSYRSTYRNSW